MYLVYGQVVHTKSNWCTHDLSMTHVYFVFNLYVDGKHKRPAVMINVRVTKGTKEVFIKPGDWQLIFTIQFGR